MFHKIAIDNAYKIASLLDRLKSSENNEAYINTVVTEIESLLFANSQILASNTPNNEKNETTPFNSDFYRNPIRVQLDEQAHLLSQISEVLNEANIPNQSSRILDLEIDRQDYTEAFKQIADNFEKTAALINNLDAIANSRIDDEDESIYEFDNNFQITFHAINLSVTILDKTIMQSINIPFNSISWIAREIKNYPRRLRLVSGEIAKTYDSTVSFKEANADFTENNTVNTDFKWSRIH